MQSYLLETTRLDCLMSSEHSFSHAELHQSTKASPQQDTLSLQEVFIIYISKYSASLKVPDKPNKAAIPHAGEYASMAFVLSIARDKWKKRRILESFVEVQILFDNLTASQLNRKKNVKHFISFMQPEYSCLPHSEMASQVN